MCLYYQEKQVPEQYDLMIAASPTTEFCFMITHDDGKLDAVEDKRVYGTYQDLDKILSDLYAEYDWRIISVYGPKRYIKKIAAEIEYIYPMYTVNQISTDV